jgi:hypothetical protein
MLTNRNLINDLQDEHDSLQEHIKTQDSAGIEQHTLLILELEKKLPSPNFNRVLEVTALSLEQGVFSQTQYDEAKPIMERVLQVFRIQQDVVDTATGDAQKGLDILRSADAIKYEADQMVNDLVEVGFTWSRAEETGRLAELQAVYAEFARWPQSYPEILAQFLRAENLYRQGLLLLEHAPEIDSNTLIFWCGRLVSVYATIGQYEEAAELEKRISAI